MICLIVGKSGSGKSTIERILEEQGFKRIISSTSRPKRKDEVDGVDYIFRTTHEMLVKASKGEMAEYQFVGNYIYGIEKTQLVSKGRKVAVVGMEGLEKLSQIEGVQIRSFYLKVPFFTRLKRMLERKDPISDIFRRIRLDPRLFKGAKEKVDHIIDGRKDLDQIADELTKKLREWEN